MDFAEVPESGRVLDAGSGTGALAYSIARRRPQCKVLGIDPSNEYIAFAAHQNRFGERVSFETGDAQQLRFSDSVFEACLSLLVVNFIPDYRKALREMVRVTKPGGIVAAAVWDYGQGMRMLRTFWDAAAAVSPSAEKRDERHMPLCRAGELAGLWKETGLRRVEERALTITMRFDSFAAFWDPFELGQGPAGAYVKDCDQRVRELIREEIRRKLSPGAGDEPFSMNGRVWAVRGIVPGRD